MKRHTSEEDAALAAAVYGAASAAGWIVPQTEETVAEAERLLPAQPTPLPDTLRDPKAVFARRERRSVARIAALPTPDAGPIDATLARAAREAGRLTPEIEEAMRRDRRAAEEKRG